MKKGFTLIEMLITVAVLGLIILIVTPNITGLLKKVSDDKYNRFLDDVFIATEAYIQKNISEYPSIKIPNEKVYIYFSDLISSNYLKSDVYDPKNKLKVSNEDFTVEVYLSDDGEYKYKLYEERLGTSTGPTIVAAQSGETHKGIVYLDPTDLSNTCTEVEASANLSSNGTPTEIKTGCMKWYIFNDSGDNYTMILDHNTTVRVKWNDSNSNVAYESSNVKPVVDDLVTTSGWEVTPRLITAQEITAIVGGVPTWNTNDYTTNYYFEGTGSMKQTLPTYSESNRSKYDWLYNNLHKCKTDSPDYGCTIEDNDETYTGYGTAGVGDNASYWTSTTIGTAGSGTYMWATFSKSMISATNSKYAGSGIRPVISIPKSTFN